MHAGRFFRSIPAYGKLRKRSTAYCLTSGFRADDDEQRAPPVWVIDSPACVCRQHQRHSAALWPPDSWPCLLRPPCSALARKKARLSVFHRARRRSSIPACSDYQEPSFGHPAGARFRQSFVVRRRSFRAPFVRRVLGQSRVPPVDRSLVFVRPDTSCALRLFFVQPLVQACTRKSREKPNKQAQVSSSRFWISWLPPSGDFW